VASKEGNAGRGEDPHGVQKVKPGDKVTIDKSPFEWTVYRINSNGFVEVERKTGQGRTETKAVRSEQVKEKRDE
jgi:hypothetical protein